MRHADQMTPAASGLRRFCVFLLLLWATV